MLVFIGDHIAENGYAPTYREIADQFGINIKTVVDALNRLQTSGKLTWESGRTRTLQITRGRAVTE
jgi:SOS-response transcriptional repressor LexA